MRTYHVTGPGVDALKIVEQDVPAAGPGQIVIQLRAASVNARDAAVVGGKYPAKLPLVPLSDGVGIITEVGAGVKEFTVGQRVCPVFSPGWEGGAPTPASGAFALGGATDGVLREYMALNASDAVAVPDHLTDLEAATLPCAALTAWSALFPVSRLQPGETVLIEGTGGVSIFALQFAKLAGARVVVVSSSDEKIEKAKELGADFGVNYRSEPEWGAAVQKLAGGVDVAVEVGGPATFPQALASLRFGGRIGQIGLLTGVDAALPLRLVVPKAVTIKGVFTGSRTSFRAMNAAISSSGLRPVIDRSFAFDDARQAVAAIGGGSFGKIGIQF